MDVEDSVGGGAPNKESVLGEEVRMRGGMELSAGVGWSWECETGGKGLSCGWYWYWYRKGLLVASGVTGFENVWERVRL